MAATENTFAEEDARLWSVVYDAQVRLEIAKGVHQHALDEYLAHLQTLRDSALPEEDFSG